MFVFTYEIDIERNYGKPKAIAKRTPVNTSATRANGSISTFDDPIPKGSHVTIVAEAETETDTEVEDGFDRANTSEVKTNLRKEMPRRRFVHSRSRSTSIKGNPGEKKVISQHDLLNKYFRRDPVVLKNVDLLRSVTFFLA